MLPALQKEPSYRLRYQIIDNFMTVDDCEKIINFARQQGVSGYRKGLNCKMKRLVVSAESTPELGNMVEKTINTFGISERQISYYHIQTYDVDDYYRLHVDYGNVDSSLKNPGKATFILYLNDVKQGGETHFPRQNLYFKPQAGRAVFWHNYLTGPEPHPDTLHEGMEILQGAKWIVQVIVGEYPYPQTARDCLVCYSRCRLSKTEFDALSDDAKDAIAQALDRHISAGHEKMLARWRAVYNR